MKFDTIDIINLQLFYVGNLFELYTGFYAGDKVCVKVPRQIQNGRVDKTVLSSYGWHDATSVFTHLGPTNVGSDIINRILFEEFVAVQKSGDAYNHSCIDLVQIVDPFERRGDYALCMPFYEGKSFADLPFTKRKNILHGALPALWDACTHRPHGDIRPENMILDPTEREFHLIDPSVYFKMEEVHLTELVQHNDFYLSTNQRVSQNGSIFTSNVFHYPIVHPYQNKSAQWIQQHISKQHNNPLVEPTSTDVLAFGIMYATALFGRHPLKHCQQFSLSTPKRLNEEHFWFTQHWHLRHSNQIREFSFPTESMLQSRFFDVYTDVNRGEFDLAYALLRGNIQHRTELMQYLSHV